MGCGCGGRPFEPKPDQQTGVPQLAGTKNPAYTWPPRGNGPKPKQTEA